LHKYRKHTAGIDDVLGVKREAYIVQVALVAWALMLIGFSFVGTLYPHLRGLWR
jgi:hypothetical protein